MLFFHVSIPCNVNIVGVTTEQKGKNPRQSLIVGDH
uniref:Uncharacterized protein n=1 Tax=Arundo donax TaxID=35708 RepID=A0A0A9ESW7_ARUDO